MAEENLGSLRVKVEADFKKFKTDLDNLKQESEKKAQTIQDAFNRRKIAFDNKFAKMRISELRGEYQRLQAEFQKKLTLNVSTLSLKATKDELNQVKSALDDVTGSSKKQNLTGWALGITAVNQAYQFLTSTFTDLKNIISASVRSSTQLEVLRANFQGSAEDLELFKTATADTVTEANLIKLSNQATDLGVSLKDQALLFSIAEDAADKYGTGVEEGMMKVIAASEGNIKGLKTLGIQKEIYEQIVNDLARAQGDEINNLDAETQKQIRLQAIIQASGVTLEQVTKKTKDNADKFESLTVRVEEAKVKLGELVSKAILPLIDAFDKSGKTGKDFASVIIGGMSVVGSFIPLLIQVKSAQALLAASTAASTTALEANTVALGTNAAAGAGWLSRFGLGIFAAIGVAIGVGAGKLIDYIRYDLPEEINKASEEAAKKLNVPEGFGKFIEDWKKGKRTIVKDGKLVTIQIVAEEDKKSWTEAGKSAGEILKKIQALTKANEDTNISVEKYKENLIEINRLQKILSVEEEKQKNAVDELVKKVQTENQLKELTHQLTLSVLASAKKTLETGLALAKNDEERLKILQAIDQIDKMVANRQGKRTSADPDTEGAKKEKQEIEKRLEERKQIEQDLGSLRIASIENEFIQREAQINSAFELEKAKLEELFEQRKISETELQEALADNQKIKEKELAKLSLEKFNAGLSAAQNIATALRNIFGDTRLINTFQQVLSIVEAIAAIMQSIGIIGAIFSGPVGAVAALKGGGSFLNGKVTPYSQIPKFAGGINFKVPPKFVNDSFLMRVSAGENVNVTPKAQVLEQEKFLAGINNKLNILNSNFVESTLQKTKQSAIPLFGKLEGKDIYISNKRSGKVIGRMT